MTDTQTAGKVSIIDMKKKDVKFGKWLYCLGTKRKQ